MKLSLKFNSTYNQEQRSSVVVELLSAIKSLDLEKMQILIADDNLFQQPEKHQFYAFIKDIFITCKEQGIQQLIQAHSVCRLCFTRRVISSFKDNTRADKFALMFHPLISNTTEIFICEHFTDPINVYSEEVYFAPLYLSEPERKLFGELMDINKITITKSFRIKDNEDDLKLAIAYYLYDNYKLATKLLDKYLDTHKTLSSEIEIKIEKLKPLLTVAKLNDPENKD